MKEFIYTDDAYISFGKKIKRYFINLIIMILVGILLTLLNVSICTNADYYQKNNQVVNTKIEKMLELTSDAYLSKKNSEGELLSLNDMYKEYATGHILLSYECNQVEFNQKGVNDLYNNEKIKDKYFAIDSSKDYLANLYYNYLPSLGDEYFDFEGLSTSEYYKKVLRETNKDLSMFDLEKEYPTLKVEFAICLYEYIVLEKTMDNPDGLNANTVFADIFTKTFDYNSALFQGLDFYQVEFKEYQNSYQKLVNLINFTYFISYSESFVLLFVIIPLFFKNRLSLGDLVGGFVVINNENKKLTFVQRLINILLDYLLYFDSIFIIAFVIGGTTAISFSLFKIGNINISLMSFIVITLIFAFVNYLVSYIRKDKASIKDVLSSSIYLYKDEIKFSPNKKS